ncbi:hypothetical protein ACTFIU_008613 [Dictyostelium citrinum]
MNKTNICTSIFKILLGIIVLGILVTLINIDSNEILIITTKTFTHSIDINGSEIGKRDYKETKYHISLKHTDIIVKNITNQNSSYSNSNSNRNSNNNSNNSENNEIIKINRYLYKNEIEENHLEISNHFTKIENLLNSFIVIIFSEFIIILILFLIPTKSKIKDQPKVINKIKIIIYSFLMILFFPLFIIMMDLVNKDLKQILLSIPILNPICLDSKSNEIGFCKEYYLGIYRIENDILKEYDSINKFKNIKTSFESYEWVNGPLNERLILILIQVIILYITIVSLIVFEYGNKSIKKTNNPYTIRN